MVRRGGPTWTGITLTADRKWKKTTASRDFLSVIMPVTQLLLQPFFLQPFLLLNFDLLVMLRKIFSRRLAHNNFVTEALHLAVIKTVQDFVTRAQSTWRNCAFHRAAAAAGRRQTRRTPIARPIARPCNLGALFLIARRQWFSVLVARTHQLGPKVKEQACLARAGMCRYRILTLFFFASCLRLARRSIDQGREIDHMSAVCVAKVIAGLIESSVVAGAKMGIHDKDPAKSLFA